MVRTHMIKRGEVKPDWFIVDASDQVLGRLASFIATRLRGKHKPEFVSHQLCGDTIVVINADKIRLTGNKASQKEYHRHTGYRLKTTSYEQMLARHPERIVQKAVKGMLPKCVLGRKMFLRLKVYASPEHPHQAQNPVELALQN